MKLLRSGDRCPNAVKDVWSKSFRHCNANMHPFRQKTFMLISSHQKLDHLTDVPCEAIFEVQVLLALERAAAPHAVELRVPRCISYKVIQCYSCGEVQQELKAKTVVTPKPWSLPFPKPGGCFATWLEGTHCYDSGSRRIFRLLH